VKSVIGDYKPGERPVDAAPSATPARPRPRNAAAKPKPAGNRKGARARRPRK